MNASLSNRTQSGPSDVVHGGRELLRNMIFDTRRKLTPSNYVIELFHVINLDTDQWASFEEGYGSSLVVPIIADLYNDSHQHLPDILTLDIIVVDYGIELQNVTVSFKANTPPIHFQDLALMNNMSIAFKESKNKDRTMKLVRMTPEDGMEINRLLKVINNPNEGDNKSTETTFDATLLGNRLEKNPTQATEPLFVRSDDERDQEAQSDIEKNTITSIPSTVNATTIPVNRKNVIDSDDEVFELPSLAAIQSPETLVKKERIDAFIFSMVIVCEEYEFQKSYDMSSSEKFSEVAARFTKELTTHLARLSKSNDDSSRFIFSYLDTHNSRLPISDNSTAAMLGSLSWLNGKPRIYAVRTEDKMTIRIGIYEGDDLFDKAEADLQKGLLSQRAVYTIKSMVPMKRAFLKHLGEKSEDVLKDYNFFLQQDGCLMQFRASQTPRDIGLQPDIMEDIFMAKKKTKNQPSKA